MSLQDQANTMLPALEAELRRQVSRLDMPGSQRFYEMLAYHMGWSVNGDARSSTGKRIRPLLLLLVAEACGGRWLHELPAAAAIELVHNFSLVHDDIEDDSPTRRGRQTVWHKYGMPMALNAGDALFALSSQAIMDLRANHAPAVVVQAAGILSLACLALTRGQFLDMSYEKRIDLSVDDYWPMIEGKTAALLSAAAEIGAVLGEAEPTIVEHYAAFGRQLGLAFQVQDDILGIWGEEGETGKSRASDLVDGKNSLPVLYGIAQKADFAKRWAASPISVDETAQLAALLREEGAYSYSLQQAERLTNEALECLRSARPMGQAGAALTELAHQLLKRQS